MSTPVVERRRTGWDVILGILLLLAGFVVLGDVVLATVVSVFVLAWTAVFSGVVLLVGALMRIRSGGSWWAAVGGALMLVMGIFMLRNPLIGAVALTLMAGAMFLSGGLVRLTLAFGVPKHKVLFAISGLASVALGVWVLFNPVQATLQLLGIMLGVQMLVDGLTLITSGRMRLAPSAA